MTCCFCGAEIDPPWGDNPAPLAEGTCCPWCHDRIVLPVRELIVDRTEERKYILALEGHLDAE